MPAITSVSEMNIIWIVGVRRYARRGVERTSHGDQRRWRSRALAAEPRLLALDRPAAGMNATETGRLKQLIRQIRNDGITVMLIEHDVKLVMGLCDRVAVLDSGNKIAGDVPQWCRRTKR